MPNETDFKPTEIWTPNKENFDLGAAIEAARHVINAKDPEKLIKELDSQVKRSDNGIVYAILRGDHPEEYSDTDALVIFNPFANTATPNMLVRAEFIREVAKKEEVCDALGKLKPIIMLASPGLHGSRLKLSSEDKRQIRRGDLGPVAKEYMAAIAAINFGRIALSGFSLGADMAIAGAKKAYSANLDTTSLSVGDPAGVKKRNLIVLAKDFGAASPDLEKEALASGMPVLDIARHSRGDYRRFAISALYPSNWSVIGVALGANSFEANMEELIDEGKIDKFIVGYGANSTIAPRKALEPSLARLHQQVDHNKLVSIRVEDKGHAWGDQLTLLAKLYLRALD